jgi:very-short-patch-repair endonuclease
MFCKYCGAQTNKNKKFCNFEHYTLWKRTPEARKLRSEFIKNLYKSHPEIIQKITESVKKHYQLHPETKKKISERAKQRTSNKNPFFGKHHTEATKKIISEKIKKYFAEHPEARQNLSLKMKGRPSYLKGKTFEEVFGEEKAKLIKKKIFENIERSKKLSESIKLSYVKNPLLIELRKLKKSPKLSVQYFKTKYPEKYKQWKQKISQFIHEFNLRRWKENREAMLKISSKPGFTHPNRLERKFRNILLNLNCKEKKTEEECVDKLDFLFNKPFVGKIPDFRFPLSKLIFEVDGSYWHQDKQTDLERDKIFEQQGYKVIHFSDNEIFYNSFEVIKQLKTLLKFQKGEVV